MCKPAAAPSAKPSPFAIADMAKDIVAGAVTLWEDAKQTEPRQIAEHLNTAAEEMRAPAEALIQAAAKLESLLKDFAARPLPEGVAVFVRESLYAM